MLTIEDPLVAGLDLSAHDFLYAIAKAQAIAEGPQGANRKLERRAVTSVLRLNGGVVYLTERPIDANEAIAVEVQAVGAQLNAAGGALKVYNDVWGRGVPSYTGSGPAPISRPGWVTLPTHLYSFDAATSRLAIAVGDYAGMPLSPSRVSYSVRVSYVAGYDFSPNSEDSLVLAMKAALLDMVMGDSAAKDSIESFTLDDFYSVKMNTKAIAAVSDSALSVFRSLRN